MTMSTLRTSAPTAPEASEQFGRPEAPDGGSGRPATTPARPEDTRPTASWWDGHRRIQVASVIALLVGTGVLYLWGLSASGYANTFYSAAAQAGSQSWKAFFYGSLDASSAITVDKPPASLWLMALSVRLFGLSSWSILAPQALLGVATVGVLFATVRRTSGHLAGLLAGIVLALTPVAALMFRFNNPDALLVLLLVLASYATLRATEKASGRWLILAGVLIGFGFLTKMLQAFVILPALIAVYLIAAPTTVRRRLLHLLGAFVAMIVSLGWWVAIVELVPASMRPYVGGSENNSVLELIFGYNGFGRIFGNEGGGMGGAARAADGAAATAGGAFGQGAGGPGGMWGQTGITRLFSGVSGGMIAWLIPAALITAGVAFVLLRRAPRTDRTRAALIIWAGSLVVTAVTFSFMAGIYHDYYTVALAPSIAATVAVAGTVLWRHRDSWPARIGLAVSMAVTGVWAFVLLSEASGQPYATIKWAVLIIAGAAALGFVFAHRLPKLLASVVLGMAMVGGLAGPASYAIQTVATPHQGSIVTAGPVSAGGPGGTAGRGQWRGQRDGADQPPSGNQQGGLQPGGTQQGGTPQGQGAPGGMGGGEQASSEVTSMLRASNTYTWAAATTGSQSAATYQLASGQPVMAIGGFNGGDPSPTLAQFQAYVAAGKIHYYIGGETGRGGGGGPGGSTRSASEISSWVSANFSSTTVGGVEVYDLTAGK